MDRRLGALRILLSEGVAYLRFVLRAFREADPCFGKRTRVSGEKRILPRPSVS